MPHKQITFFNGLLGGGSTLAEAFDYDNLGNRVTYYDHRNSITTAYGKVAQWGYRDFDFDRDGDG